MKREPRSPGELLPLSDLGYHVLVSLGGEVLHGYALGQRVSELSGGRLRPTTGALYQLLRRYLDGGILERAEAPAAMAGDSRRQFFAITPFGREVRALETERLRALVSRGEVLDNA